MLQEACGREGFSLGCHQVGEKRGLCLPGMCVKSGTKSIHDGSIGFVSLSLSLSFFLA